MLKPRCAGPARHSDLGQHSAGSIRSHSKLRPLCWHDSLLTGLSRRTPKPPMTTWTCLSRLEFNGPTSIWRIKRSQLAAPRNHVPSTTESNRVTCCLGINFILKRNQIVFAPAAGDGRWSPAEEIVRPCSQQNPYSTKTAAIPLPVRDSCRRSLEQPLLNYHEVFE
jgi:hypothetical protein